MTTELTQRCGSGHATAWVMSGHKRQTEGTAARCAELQTSSSSVKPVAHQFAHARATAGPQHQSAVNATTVESVKSVEQPGDGRLQFGQQ